MQDLPEIMDVIQASQFLQINANSLSVLAHDGKIPAFKIKNKWRFLKSKLLEWAADESKKNVHVEESKNISVSVESPLYRYASKKQRNAMITKQA